MHPVSISTYFVYSWFGSDRDLFCLCCDVFFHLFFVWRRVVLQPSINNIIPGIPLGPDIYPVVFTTAVRLIICL